MSLDLTEVLLCHRVESKKIAPRPGVCLPVGTIACVLCKAECWISQSSVDFLSTNIRLKVVCMECACNDPRLTDEDAISIRRVPGSETDMLDFIASNPGLLEKLTRR